MTTCSKVKYPSRRAARRACKNLRRLGIVNYYLCSHCTMWHTTSKRPIPEEELRELRRLLAKACQC